MSGEAVRAGRLNESVIADLSTRLPAAAFVAMGDLQAVNELRGGASLNMLARLVLRVHDLEQAIHEHWRESTHGGTADMAFADSRLHKQVAGVVAASTSRICGEQAENVKFKFEGVVADGTGTGRSLTGCSGGLEQELLLRQLGCMQPDSAIVGSGTHFSSGIKGCIYNKTTGVKSAAFEAQGKEDEGKSVAECPLIEGSVPAGGQPSCEAVAALLPDEFGTCPVCKKSILDPCGVRHRHAEGCAAFRVLGC